MKPLPIISIILSVLFFIPFSSVIGLILAIIAFIKRDKKSYTLESVALAIGVICAILNLITTAGLIIGFIRSAAI